MKHSPSEENYLKAIYKLLEKGRDRVSTNELSKKLDTKAPSVTDMLKKLQRKNMIDYTPYYGVNLTEKGKKKAIEIIRKHRLWETFLVEKLEIPQEHVHEIAEELEHIRSDRLIDALEKFLDYPRKDPHGQKIPSKTEHL